MLPSVAMNTPNAPKLYKTGTLSYTRNALAIMFFWMLWGEFCLELMEAVVPGILPLQLKRLGARDTVVAVFTSVSQIAYVVLGPTIAMQSDRHRGAFGRRRPFLLACTPFAVASLVLMGFTDNIAEFLYKYSHAFISLPETEVKLICLGVFCLFFYIANTYVIYIYWFLYVDVVPIAVIGRFAGLYRVCGALGGFAFNRWLFGHAEHHTAAIYTIAAGIYGFAFILLTWRVKEGSYPPPEPRAIHGSIFLNDIKFFCRECFSNSFYIKLFSVSLCFWSTFSPFIIFVLFFATKGTAIGYAPTLELPLEVFGKVRGWTFVAQVPVFLLIGPLIDRLHPLRIMLVALLALSVSYFSGYLFVYSERGLLVWWVTNQMVFAAALGAYGTLFPRLCPRDIYGAFFAANQVFFMLGLAVITVACGWLMEVTRNYRDIFIVSGGFSLLAFVMCLSVFRHWKRLGGDDDFVPPRYQRKPETTALRPSG